MLKVRTKTSENGNAVVLASNSLTPFLWMFATYLFIRNSYTGKAVDHEPRIVACLVCLGNLFHIYNFIVPYFVASLSMPVHTLALIMYVSLVFTIIELGLIVIVTLRHRSSPYYLMDAETTALLKLESTRKKGDVKPFVRLVISTVPEDSSHRHLASTAPL